MNFDDYIVDTVSLLENADHDAHVAPQDHAERADYFKPLNFDDDRGDWEFSQTQHYLNDISRHVR